MTKVKLLLKLIKPQLQQQQSLLSNLQHQHTLLAEKQCSLKEGIEREKENSAEDFYKYSDYTRYEHSVSTQLKKLATQSYELETAIKCAQEKLLELYSEEQRYLKYLELKQQEATNKARKSEQGTLDEIALRMQSNNN